MFSERFKEFINNNSHLIEEGDWDSLYEHFKYSGCSERAKTLTKILQSIDVDPLQTMSYVPMGYLREDQYLKEIILRNNYKIKEVDQFAFYRCENLNYVEFAEGLEIIGHSAFAACSKLEELYLPSTLKEIHTDAFKLCYELKNIYFGGSMDNWLKVDQKNGSIFSNVPARKIKCIDGLVRLRNI